MRDVQHRLVALGYPVTDDELGTYGEGTVAAVRAFQERRGLRTDGVCGGDTWAALVEAGYRLGDRPLYLTSPMLRGDDVAELQRRLGPLGFDAGRVDGILGPRTDRALADFQRNAGLVTDSICGPATLTALARLGLSGQGRSSVSMLREQERHRGRPHSLTGRAIAVGETGGLDALATLVVRALADAGARAFLVQHPDESTRAAQANAADADVYLGLSLEEGPDVGCLTSYYRSPTGDESPGGRRLAELVHGALLDVCGGRDGGVRGMAVPVLRETRMPAIVAELGAPSVVVERAHDLASGFVSALQRWVTPPPPPDS